jgi:hypothetical protein
MLGSWPALNRKMPALNGKMTFNRNYVADTIGPLEADDINPN